MTTDAMDGTFSESTTDSDTESDGSDEWTELNQADGIHPNAEAQPVLLDVGLGHAEVHVDQALVPCGIPDRPLRGALRHAHGRLSG